MADKYFVTPIEFMDYITVENYPLTLLIMLYDKAVKAKEHWCEAVDQMIDDFDQGKIDIWN